MRPTPFLILTFVSLSAAHDLGIDVSHWNGVVDWGKVKAAGMKVAIAKATEGSTYIDNTFSTNWRGITSNGLRGGAYHYLRGAQSAAAQVQNIKHALHAAHFGANDILVIDVEQGGNEAVSAEGMADTLKGVLDGLKGEFTNLWIYTGPWYWENKVAWRRHDFSGYKLWIAHYTANPSPDVPSTWASKGWALWQYTDKGRVNGVSGNVDVSRTS